MPHLVFVVLEAKLGLYACEAIYQPSSVSSLVSLADLPHAVGPGPVTRQATLLSFLPQFTIAACLQGSTVSLVFQPHSHP